MIPPGDCMYAGRKRRKPIQKQRPVVGAEKSNPSKRHRDRLNAELDHLASLLPLPPDVIAKLDKLSVLRLSVSYLRLKSFFQALQERCPRQSAARDGGPHRASAVLEGRLLLESLHGFALVVSAEGMIFYASATIVDYLGFHQTDVMHQSVYDYIHVDDRQDFCRQLHWAMDPPQALCAQPLLPGPGEDAVLARLLQAQEGAAAVPPAYSAFLTRCFTCRVRCLLDSTSGFLTMQFRGKLRFLFGQKRKTPSGAALPPRLSLFCVAVPVLLPPVAEVSGRSAFLRARHRVDVSAAQDAGAKATSSLCQSELHGKPNCLAGRSNGENGLSVFRAPTDACRWGRGPARAPCLCFRGSPDLVLDREGATGDMGGEGPGGARRDVPPHSCRLEAPGSTKHPSWTTEKHGQDGSAELKLDPCRSHPFSVLAQPRGACLPRPGLQGTVQAGGTAAFGNPVDTHPPRHPPCTCTGRTSRAVRGGHQGQLHPPPSCSFPQGGLDAVLPQRLPAGGYPTEDKFRGGAMLPGVPRNAVSSLNVPIKTERDSGAEDTADGYSVSPSQVWLGASNAAKSQLGTFPTRMHLKTEPDSRHPLYSLHLRHGGLLGAHPRPGREPAPFQPAPCTCLEPPPRLARSHQPPTGDCDCRAPGPAPVVKLEPLDLPPWAAHSQGGVPGMFPKSALTTRMPARDAACAFLP
uniref:Aryl hydrocarbon receptor repressor n=1 Tax=Catagonus wagneri TaxID=51154 RepID=A0A8C3VQ40_9CETA